MATDAVSADGRLDSRWRLDKLHSPRERYHRESCPCGHHSAQPLGSIGLLNFGHQMTSRSGLAFGGLHGFAPGQQFRDSLRHATHRSVFCSIMPISDIGTKKGQRGTSRDSMVRRRVTIESKRLCRPFESNPCRSIPSDDNKPHRQTRSGPLFRHFAADGGHR